MSGRVAKKNDPFFRQGANNMDGLDGDGLAVGAVETGVPHDDSNEVANHPPHPPI